MDIEKAKKSLEILLKFENEYIYFEEDELQLGEDYYFFYNLDTWIEKIKEMYKILLDNGYYSDVFNSIHVLQKVYKYYKHKEILKIIENIEENDYIKKISLDIFISSSDSDNDSNDDSDKSILIEKSYTAEEIMADLANERKAECKEQCKNDFKNEYEPSNISKMLDKILNDEFNFVEKKKTHEQKNKKIPRPPPYPPPTLTSYQNSFDNKIDENNIKIDEEVFENAISNNDFSFSDFIKTFFNLNNFKTGIVNIKNKIKNLYYSIKNKIMNK